jgi:acyl-coenzyme A thioesterase PaaI-like protein
MQVPDDEIPEELMRVLAPEDEKRLIGPGHVVGDLLEAPLWEVLLREPGHLRVRAHLPDAVRNPRGQLFGGFTGTYVDFMSIFTYWAGRTEERGTNRSWLATLNMRIDYFAPVVGPHFEMEGRTIRRGGSTGSIETRFFDPGSPGGDPLVFAHATLKEVR